MSDNAFNIKHLAIIMDGNGRWASARGLERSAGHRAGAENVLRIVKAAEKFNIKYLTLYAFSTDNWKRPAGEIAGLMKLLQDFLQKQLPVLHKENVRLNAIGRLDDLPAAVRASLLAAMRLTEKNDGGVLTLALSYGGRAELTDAVKKMIKAAKAGELDENCIDEKCVAGYLYDPELPDPELVIRTSGEMRTSNFLLWQMAYSELYVSSVMWPDFGEAELLEALKAYQQRDRRFGGLAKK